MAMAIMGPERQAGPDLGGGHGYRATCAEEIMR